MKDFSYSIIILAAGFSSRLGRAKQLLTINGNTLLKRSIDTACKTAATSIVVVVNDQLTVDRDVQHQVKFVVNKESAAGISSSIIKGVETVIQIKPQSEAVVVMVCDQPAVDETIIADIISLHLSSGMSLVATTYAGTVGTPALFHCSYFGRLLQLQGNAGAKSILMKYAADLATIAFPDGDVDIDTEADWQAFLNNK